MKLKLLAIIIVAFIFSGCYATSPLKSGETYAQSHNNYAQSHYNIDVYIDYEFECAHCYYEMYWCFNCQTYHVHVTHWCHNHYYWYHNWYRIHYYRPYAYYHNHYTSHVYYRDATRHYIRDHNGLRNTRGGRPDNNFKLNDDKIYKDSKIYKQRDVKRYDNNTKQKYNDINKNKTYEKRNNVKYENKTYQRQNNTQKQNIQKPPVQRNSGDRNMKKR